MSAGFALGLVVAAAGVHADPPARLEWVRHAESLGAARSEAEVPRVEQLRRALDALREAEHSGDAARAERMARLIRALAVHLELQRELDTLRAQGQEGTR